MLLEYPRFETSKNGDNPYFIGLSVLYYSAVRFLVVIIRDLQNTADFIAMRKSRGTHPKNPLFFVKIVYSLAFWG